MKFLTVAIIACASVWANNSYARFAGKAWERSIELGRSHTLQSIQATFDGGFVMGGHVAASDLHTDLFVLKLDGMGKEVWHKLLGGAGLHTGCYVIQTSDGGYFAAGTATPDYLMDTLSLNRSDADFHVFRLDGSGNTIWERKIGGSGNDNVTTVLQTPDGGYIVGGNSISGRSGDKTEETNGFSYDFWIVKLKETGEIEWQRTIGGPGDEFLSAMNLTENGGVVLGGTSLPGLTGNLDNVSYEASYRIARLSAGGGIVWDKTFNSEKDNFLSDVQQTDDGGYVVAGFIYDHDPAGQTAAIDKKEADFQLLKLYADGSVQWKQISGSRLNESLTSLIRSKDGGYILGGYAYPSPGDADGHMSYKVLKYSSPGTWEWEMNIDESAQGHPCLMAAAGDGGYIVAGSESEPGAGPVHNHLQLSFYNETKITSGSMDEDKGIAGICYNPATETVEVTCRDSIMIKGMYVISAEGRQILKRNLYEKRTSFNTSALAPGVYIVNLVTDRGFQSLRFVIAR